MTIAVGHQVMTMQERVVSEIEFEIVDVLSNIEVPKVRFDRVSVRLDIAQKRLETPGIRKPTYAWDLQVVERQRCRSSRVKRRACTGVDTSCISATAADGVS
jgi:hypothetical protein